MINFGPTFVWTAVNLLVLFLILRRLLFKNVTQFMNNRTKSIQDAINSSEKNKLDALELKQKYESQIRSARDEADRILEVAHTRASEEYAAIIGTAKKEAENILHKAQEEAENERIRMLKTAKGQMVEIALLAASKVIEANMDTEKNRSLVERFIEEAGAA